MLRGSLIAWRRISTIGDREVAGQRHPVMKLKRMWFALLRTCNKENRYLIHGYGIILKRKQESTEDTKENIEAQLRSVSARSDQNRI